MKIGSYYNGFTPDEGRERKEIVCPVCGNRGETFYTDSDKNIIGCDNCVRVWDYYELEEELYGYSDEDDEGWYNGRGD